MCLEPHSKPGIPRQLLDPGFLPPPEASPDAEDPTTLARTRLP